MEGGSRGTHELSTRVGLRALFGGEDAATPRRP